MIDWEVLTDYVKAIEPADFLPDDFRLTSMADVRGLLDDIETYDGLVNEETRPTIPMIKRRLTEMSANNLRMIVIGLFNNSKFPTLTEHMDISLTYDEDNRSKLQIIAWTEYGDLWFTLRECNTECIEMTEECRYGDEDWHVTGLYKISSERALNYIVSEITCTNVSDREPDFDADDELNAIIAKKWKE